MTSNNETVTRQNSMTSVGNSALLPAIVDRCYSEDFLLYNKSLKDLSLGKQLILFPSNLDVSRGEYWGNKLTVSLGPVIKSLLSTAL